MKLSLFLLPAAVLLISVSVDIGRCTCHAMLIPLPPPRRVQISHRQITNKAPNNSNPRISLALNSNTPNSVIVERDESKSTTSNNDNTNNNCNTKNKKAQLVAELGSSFTQKLFELEGYQRENGNCLVPKRYESNPSLGNWVNKQRQNYRKLLKGEKTSMNEVCVVCLVHVLFSLQRNASSWKFVYPCHLTTLDE